MSEAVATFNLTELQHSDDRKGPWRLYIYAENGRGLSAKVIHILNCHFPTNWASENLRERVIEFGEDVANQAPVNQELLEALDALKCWLTRQLETDGDGNSWAAVAIPEWDARQRIDEISAAIAKATGEVQP